MIHEIRVPQAGESVTEAYIGRWNKKSGDIVKKGEVLVELESQKANFELEAESSGQITILFPEEGTAVPTGEIIARIDDSMAANENQAASTTKPATAKESRSVQTTPAPAAPPKPNTGTFMSPSVRKLVTENNLDVLKIKTDKPAPAAKNVVPVDTSRGDRVERASRIRQQIAKNLLQAQQTAAILTTFNEVDMSAVMDFRKANKEAYQKNHGVSLGMASFFCLAAARTLTEAPLVNSYFDGENIIYHDYVDLSVAVSTDRGLVVPVVRNVHSMDLVAFEKELGRLSERARDGKLSIPEMTGGTFTVSNGGVFGSLISTPILNSPQTAILGLHKIEKRPIVIDDQITIRPMMYITMSYDHRIIDGKEAVTFLVNVKKRIETLEGIVGAPGWGNS